MIIAGGYHDITLWKRGTVSWLTLVDIAKLNHFATAISSDGEIVIESFKYTNNYDGFYLLNSKLAPLDQNSIIIGLESTTHYSDNLAHFLINKDFKGCVLNPLSTSVMRKNNVRKAKSDKADTFVIAPPYDAGIFKIYYS